MRQIGDLQIGEDFPTQKKLWAFQRLGAGVMLALVLASMIGLISPGGWSETIANQDPGLRVGYQRVLHYGTKDEVTVELAPDHWRAGTAVLQVNREYFEKIRVERVVPEPDGVVADAEGFRYEFRVAETRSPMTVIFHIEPRARGLAQGRIAIPGAEPLRFRQFVFP